MSDSFDLRQRVNRLESILQETRKGLERQRQTRGRIAKALVAAVQEVRALGSCVNILPDPLKTFCAGDPAKAYDINYNFKTLAASIGQLHNHLRLQRY